MYIEIITQPTKNILMEKLSNLNFILVSVFQLQSVTLRYVHIFFCYRNR